MCIRLSLASVRANEKNPGVDGPRRCTKERLQRAMTLVEVTIVIAIVGVLTLITVASMSDWFANQRLKGTARSMADLLMLARSEAIRTGDRYAVFFGPLGSSDPAGTPLVDAAGQVAMMVALDDGAPAGADCRINGGEAREAVSAAADVTPGVAVASSRAPNDTGGAPFTPPQTSGSTFQDPTGNARTWMMFQPDGIPVVFTAGGTNCGAVGATGTGGGALYLTNGERDYAVVLSPLGAVRVHAWRGAAWSS